MKHTCLSLILACSALAGFQAHGQTRTPLPPPQKAPAGLPPLPGGVATPPASLPGSPTQQPPPAPRVGDNADLPTVDLTSRSKPNFNTTEFFTSFNAELVRLDQAIGSQVRVVGVEAGSAEHNMATSTAKSEKIGGLDPHVINEVIPAGVLASGQYKGVGGPFVQSCVVIIDPEKAAQAWETYVLPPQAAGSHPQTGYAWMAAHAVGHCLDANSRNKLFRSKLAWKLNEATNLGLWPAAVSSSFNLMGGSFAKDAFMNASERVYSQPTQRQFSERGADVFASLWIIRLGASQEGLAALSKARMNDVGDDGGIASVRRGRAYDRAKASERADRLWDLAREVQKEIGVDNSRIASTRSSNGNNSRNPDEEVAQWIVTPQGVMGVDSQGRIIRLPNTTEQVNGGRNFKDLKRFGQ